MQAEPNRPAYLRFLDFVQEHNQTERSRVNRRMLSVILWCFLLPALFLAIVFILIHLGWFPKRFKHDVDWLILVFPIAYALYYLGREVVVELPNVIRRGGMATALKHTTEAFHWREKTCQAMTTGPLRLSSADWELVASHFRIDLKAMQYRARYLTGFAGAIFFLILQGIDTIGEDTSWLATNALDFSRVIERVLDHISEMVGLGLFLLLLYLSGSQMHHLLERYLHCVELILERLKKDGQA